MAGNGDPPPAANNAPPPANNAPPPANNAPPPENNAQPPENKPPENNAPPPANNAPPPEKKPPTNNVPNKEPVLPGSEQKEQENFPFDPRDGKKKDDQVDKQPPQPRPVPPVDGKPCEQGNCDDKKKEIDANDQFKWPWEAAKPKILIISLKGSASRRNFMQQQCNTLQQSCTFIDAVAGHDLTPTTVNDVAHHAKMRLSRNEVGCFFSHKACWQKIVEDQLPFAIIVEDDVTVSKDISYLASLYIPQLEILDPNWDVLYLGFNHDVDFKTYFDELKAKKLPMPPVIQDNMNNPKYWIDQMTDSPLFVRPRPRWGLFGSVISQKGAQKLIRLLGVDGVNYPVDWQLWFQREPREAGLRSYALKSAVQQNQLGKYTMLVTHPYTFHSDLGHKF